LAICVPCDRTPKTPSGAQARGWRMAAHQFFGVVARVPFAKFFE
jgi:hypothetical protein